jgi:hypothetical protein
MPQRRSLGFAYSPKRNIRTSDPKSQYDPLRSSSCQFYWRITRRMNSCHRCAVLSVMIVLIITLAGCVLSDADAANLLIQTNPTAASTNTIPYESTNATGKPMKTLAPSHTPVPSATPEATGISAPTGTPSPTAAETTVPTSEPTQEVVAAPTQKPTETTTETSAGVFLEIASITSPVAKGDNASLTAKTAPGILCQITVYYKSGPSKAKGLDPKNADENGNVTWTWKVGSATSSGNWRIVVKANIDGKEVSKEVYFTVQ